MLIPPSLISRGSIGMDFYDFTSDRDELCIIIYESFELPNWKLEEGSYLEQLPEKTKGMMIHKKVGIKNEVNNNVDNNEDTISIYLRIYITG